MIFSENRSPLFGIMLLSRVEPDREADFRHVLLGLANGELAEMKDRGGERCRSVAVANAFHQMFEIPDTSVPAGTVVQIMQPGYTIGERVLRPALVGVSKGGPRAAPATDTPANDNTTGITGK